MSVTAVQSQTQSLNRLAGEWLQVQDQTMGDRLLSQEGKEQRLKTLGAQYTERIVTAGQRLFEAMQAELEERNQLLARTAEQEAAKWDYGRLAYTTQVLESRLVAARASGLNGITALLDLYERDSQLADPYTMRAWRLRAPVFAESDSQELRQLGGKLARELKAETDPELANADRVVMSDSANVEAYRVLVRANDAIGGQVGGFFGSRGGLGPVLDRLEKRSRLEDGVRWAEWVEILPEPEPVRMPAFNA